MAAFLLVASRIWGAVWSVLKICIPIPIAAILAVLIWAHFDKSSAIKTALGNYVHSAQVASLEASVAEKQRQLVAIRNARGELLKAIDAMHAAEAAAAEKQAQDDHDYEQKLQAAECHRGLTDDDIGYLVREP